jgi:hypothetical protein
MTGPFARAPAGSCDRPSCRVGTHSRASSRKTSRLPAYNACKTVGVQSGIPVVEDGRIVDVPNVIWCTGFEPDFGWIDLPFLDDDGQPIHDRGIVEAQPGLYFVGLPFLFALTSSLVGGVGRDAEYIAARRLAHRRCAT